MFEDQRGHEMRSQKAIEEKGVMVAMKDSRGHAERQ